MQSDQQRAFLAVILSGIVLFLWQYFFVPKVVNTLPSPQTNVATVATPGVAGSTALPSQDSLPVAAEEAKEYVISQGNWRAVINSNLVIKNLSAINSVEPLKTIVGDENFLDLNFLKPDRQENNVYQITQSSESEVMITNSAGLNFRVFFDEVGKLHFQGNLPKSEGVHFNFLSKVSTDSNHPRNFFYHVGKLKQNVVGDDGDDSGNAKWFGVDYAHHFVGVVSPGAAPADFLFTEQNGMHVKSYPPSEKVDFYLVFVKKEYEFLKNLGDSLHLTVDFGFFAFLAIPILWLLKFFHGLFSNYGVAIIALTLLMRLLTFPLQLSSLKGMKKMQVLQPELAKIKEKHKDNPVALQKETMEIFKKSGVNPLSGCFPLLLQMPIFFALYSVLYNAVELVGADFFGWIHDLSLRDPYYILPLLMTVSMFVQQKITPSTMTDKMQQRIFLFMPIIFGFFMKDLPSGLSLYIFVSTLAGIIQQVLVFSRLK